jgi:hypothetical protein
MQIWHKLRENQLVMTNGKELLESTSARPESDITESFDGARFNFAHHSAVVGLLQSLDFQQDEPCRH